MMDPTRWALALALAALLGNVSCASGPAPTPTPERHATASPVFSPEIEAVLREVREKHGSGSAGTFYARLAIQPSRDLAVAVVTNAGDEDAGEAAREVIRALMGQSGSR